MHVKIHSTFKMLCTTSKAKPFSHEVHKNTNCAENSVVCIIYLLRSTLQSSNFGFWQCLTGMVALIPMTHALTCTSVLEKCFYLQRKAVLSDYLVPLVTKEWYDRAACAVNTICLFQSKIFCKYFKDMEYLST